MPLSAALTATVFAVAAVVSALLTAGWIAFAKHAVLMDQPGGRRLHGQATPRGGGAGIALLTAGAWYAWSTQLLVGLPTLWVGSGIALFALVGLIDDFRPMAALPKLTGQLLAAAVLCAGTPEPQSLLGLLLILACAYWVNIVNFMDGSNGMVGTQGLLLALVLAAWPGQQAGLVVMALVLAGACAGFLPFNLGVARVFLGDVGSHAIGAALFALFLASWRAGVLPLACALTLATPLLLDSGLTLARRVLAGRTPWRAHREHLYQYAVRTGSRPLQVALAYAGWTLASSLLSILGLTLRSSSVMWTLCILNAALGSAAYFGLRQRWLLARRHRRVG